MKIHITTPNYELYYKDIYYSINDIHPLLELKREKILDKIKMEFYLVFYKYAGPKEYYTKSKKTLYQITTDILSKLIINSLAFNNTIDPVIPINIDLKMLESEIKTLISMIRHYDDILKNKMIKKITKTYNKILPKLFNDGYAVLLEYYNSDLYKKLVDDINVYITNSNGSLELYYHNHPVFIKKHLYNKIMARFPTQFAGNKFVYVWCLCKRYSMLTSLNNQLAVNPYTMSKLKEKLNINFELFGSVFNTYNNSYCSMFYDIEKIFGSFGSFFDIELIRGNFSVNPPFDNDVIFKTMIHIENNMKKYTKNKFLFVIWIPIWDDDGKYNFVLRECLKDMRTREELDAHYYNIHKTERPKKEFEYTGYNVILHSVFNKHIRKICSNNITYINYVNNAKKYVANTYMITLSNVKINTKIIDNINVKQ
jgi:hypothetical protein